ncbi:histidine phosphatase family protein [Bosea sp. (in: a-proteobacteria)]|uniref:histidine phosphatase family protein n=1 Tax=Bosea sp. (in: a-proteobacteria) TaxID=1871050 RepID=UPI00273296E7|nr:histidine phosphatase family protein [Bosea sp. (in: a-proteobacteria)]MDP3406816.1 histidine phosphatase family protein [Bosea sp. (in: a-proteobacteria)]
MGAATTKRRALLLLAAFLGLSGPALGIETDRERLWSALATPGHVVLMRHADAPGTGDPAAMRLGDCTTQRNLGARGRAQARQIGEAFRQRAIPVALVLTSQWCRTRETAELLALGPVEEEPAALNSFFGRPGEREAATAALRRRLAALPPQAATVVMVTHQVNITALTGVFPASGEMVVLTRDPQGGIVTVGRLPPP